MSSAVTTGVVTYPIASGGATASLIVGSPVITTASTAGPTLTYVEQAGGTLYVAQGDGVVTVSFQTLTAADLLYVGTDQAIDVIIDGGSAVSLEAGGFIFMSLAGNTSMTVEATTSNEATITVLLLGD